LFYPFQGPILTLGTTCDLGDIVAMAHSIKEVGLLQPILLGTDLPLISGIRKSEVRGFRLGPDEGREQENLDKPVLCCVLPDPSGIPIVRLYIGYSDG